MRRGRAGRLKRGRLRRRVRGGGDRGQWMVED